MIYDNGIYFSCYSPNLKKYLEENGFNVTATFTHFKTNKICWVFERNDKLAECLVAWTNNKK